MKKTKVRKFLKQTLLIGLIGFPVGLLMCPECLKESGLIFKAGIFSSVIWIFMWQGNGLLSDFISSKISWMDNPGKRLAWGVAGILIYTPLAMLFLNFIFGAIWNVNMGMTSSFRNFVSTAGVAVGITVVISLFLNARAFFLSWRQTSINAEKLKQESIKSQFEALKAQINPHFLFNSLNTLSSLVYVDADQSARFIKQLSNVYRYILENQFREVVDISEEINFVNAYVYLQKIRFGDNLKIEFNLSGTDGCSVPPLSIQTLIENAIKHNEISEEHPLLIQITGDGQYLEVKNSIRIKNRPVTDSPHIGLKNLDARIQLLTDKKLSVENNHETFTVRVPIIHKYHESSTS